MPSFRSLDMDVNKTDANDAEGLAHLVRAGWYREVRVKGRSAMLAKALLGARSQLLSMSLALENQIRGIQKTFGRIVPKGAGGLFEKNVRALIMDDAEITVVVMPLLQARQMARGKCAALGRRIIRSVQGDATCGTWARPFSLVRCGRLKPSRFHNMRPQRRSALSLRTGVRSSAAAS
jgi:transposase